MWAFAGPGVMKGIGAGKVVFRPTPGTLRVGQPAFWISAYSGDPVISGTIRWQFWGVTLVGP
jgi:hypothetical protein